MIGDNQSILKVDSLTKTYKKDGKDLFALDHVSFELKKGEVLGVIGRNGAGKSTLLKVLSQITSPSSGEIVYEGQLTSIIDIGTGFHADLTGEENVYLSAQLLGYSNRQIRDLYDQIVDFSGLHDFMKMPVKHYSSGMYLRLAFSIAFHANISILLLDEVIAVGDTDFKRKCYSKIKELKTRGVSIIIVSHHLDLIVEQCDRCLILDDGRILSDGKPLEVVNQYYEIVENNVGASVRSEVALSQSRDSFSLMTTLPQEIEQFSINSIELLSHDSCEEITTNTSVSIRFVCYKKSDKDSFEIGIYLVNMSGVRVLLDSIALRSDYEVKNIQKGNYFIDVVIPPDLLSAGVYRIGVMMCANRSLVRNVDDIAKFRVQSNDDLAEARGMGSIIRPKLDWKIRKGDV